MPKQTIQAQLERGLLALNYQPLPSLTRYKRFTILEGSAKVYFLGRNGALRVSSKGTLVASVPCGNRVREAILEAGRRKGNV